MGQAMDYWKENQDEANEIMAKGLKIDVEEFVATAEGLKFLDNEANKELFGTEDAKGGIYQSTENAAKFYKEQGIITAEPAAEDIINPTFIK